MSARVAVLALIGSFTVVVAGQGTEPSRGAIGGFMSAQGFEAVPLQRRFGNHLWLRGLINSKGANLAIDNSAPTTLIHRDAAENFGLPVTASNERVMSIFGPADTYGRSRVQSLRIGQRVFVDIPVVVADPAVWLDPPEFLIVPKLKPNAKRRKLSYYTNVDPVNGLVGADLLRKSRAVLDCGHQVLYLSAQRGTSSASQQLAAFLAQRGFTQIPIRLTHAGQFEVDAILNEEQTRLLVSTGASFTLLARPAAAAAHVMSAPLRLVYPLQSGALRQLSGGSVRDLRIGDFEVQDAIVSVTDISAEVLRSKNPAEKNAGLLGLDLLSRNFAVLDCGGMSLYMRHSDQH